MAQLDEHRDSCSSPITLFKRLKCEKRVMRVSYATFVSQRAKDPIPLRRKTPRHDVRMKRFRAHACSFSYFSVTANQIYKFHRSALHDQPNNPIFSDLQVLILSGLSKIAASR